MGLVVKKDYQFDARVKLPVDQGTPANRDVWFDSASGKLAFHIAGSDFLVPLASEISGSGLTQEQIEDFIALLIVDNSILDWTYNDGTPSLVAIIKDGVVANAQLADVATATIKGRVAGGTGVPTDLSVAQVKTLLALASTDLSDFTAAARAAITVLDTATVDFTYSGGQIQAAVLDSPLLGGDSKATIQANIIAAISAGAHSAYDTLLELENLIITDVAGIASLVTAVGNRARYFAGTVPNGAATANIDHNLGLTNIHDFTARVFVAATGAEEEYAMVGSTSNRVVLTDETGANIASGRRIFLTAGV